jgi:hypothetical protein
LRSWIRSAKSASKRSGIRSAPRRQQVVSGRGLLERARTLACWLGHLCRNGRQPHVTALPKIGKFAAGEGASACGGGSNSLIRGRNRIPSGVADNTTSCNRFHDCRGRSRPRSADPSDRSRYFCPAVRVGSGSRFH